MINAPLVINAPAHVELKIVDDSGRTLGVDAEGEIAMECTPLNTIETDLLWKREKRRMGATGEL